MTKVLILSLGCDKNLVDSEYMMTLLAEKGYELTDLADEAELIIINTCCFIGDAKEESIRTILTMAEYKKTGNARGLIVTGCLAERYREEVFTELPEVDAIVGTNSWDEIAEVASRVLAGQKPKALKAQEAHIDRPNRLRSDVRHYAYLKIAEGCDKRCTYCIIPYIRGNYRSVPMEELLSEARSLAEQGAAELILVAQETCSYGIDLYGKKRLPELLRALSRIDGVRWIRLLYCYPEELTDEIIAEIRQNSKVCHYLDLPIQHASDAVLSRMGRKTTRREIIARIRQLREEIPDIALRTTLITGFPGETEADMEELLSFVREIRFDRLGVFPYSPEEGTKAEAMDAQIEESVKESRRDAVMALSEELIFEKNETLIGKTFPVLVEGYLPEEEIYVGRTYRDAPDVDGYVFFPYDGELLSGTLIPITVTGSHGYDLVGEVAL